MKYTNLGNTGISVSRICLGMMSFGDSRPWTLELDDAKPLVDRALDAGVNFYDTANVYATGRSEEITGELLKEHRDDVVVATKIRFPMADGENDSGLNRYHMHRQIKKSLERLQMDFVDLYQIHRWDYKTEIEYVMRSLNQLIDSGDVLHIGASSMYAWEFAKAQFTAERLGLEKFVSMQNHYNAAYREEEREMNPLCIDQNVALIPWSPLARGMLARTADDQSKRKETDQISQRWYTDENDKDIVEQVRIASQENDVSMGQIALAWILAQPGVTSPIIGVTKMNHLEDAIAAVELNIDKDYFDRISEAYTVRPVIGHAYGSMLS